MSESGIPTTEPVTEPASAPAAPAPDPQPVPEPSPATGTDPAALQAELEKWKALSRKNEQRAKDNAEKAQRFDEFEESNKSELQKALDRAAQAERDKTDAEAQLLRTRKSNDSGVPVGLIHGSTEAEMDSAIEAALAWHKPTVAPAAPASLVTAPSGSTKTVQLTRTDLKSMSHAEILAAKKDGRMDELLGKTPK